jgi:hypothetical protein
VRAVSGGRAAARIGLAEVHLVASTLLSCALLFFALTGFMARHRGWFHAPVDRDALADPVALESPCDAMVLSAFCGVPAPAASGDGLLWVDAEASRCACVPGEAFAFRGVRDAERTLGPTEADRRQAVIDGFVGRLQEPPRRGDTRERYRLDHLSGRTTVSVDDDGVGVTVWALRYPRAFAWIEAHRGRGEASVLVDIVAGLTAVTALTGLWLLVRRTRRRRVLAWSLGALAAVLLAVLASV